MTIYSPHWSAFEWDWLLLIIPGDTGAHLDAQFPVALQCINIPLSLPSACLSVILSLPSFCLYRSLSVFVFELLCLRPLIVALWSEKSLCSPPPSWKRLIIGVYQTTETLLLAVICAAQHHRLREEVWHNPLCVSRSVFQRRRLFSRANYVNTATFLAQEPKVRSTCTHKPLKGGC